MASHAQQELTRFLIQHAFEPVIKAKVAGRSDAEQRTLKHVQDATRAEIERYEGYGSAEEVVINFKRDLHSGAAKKVHAELQALHLPTVHDVRDTFVSKARELGISG